MTIDWQAASVPKVSSKSTKNSKQPTVAKNTRTRKQHQQQQLTTRNTPRKALGIAKSAKTAPSFDVSVHPPVSSSPIVREISQIKDKKSQTQTISDAERSSIYYKESSKQSTVTIDDKKSQQNNFPQQILINQLNNNQLQQHHFKSNLVVSKSAKFHSLQTSNSKRYNLNSSNKQFDSSKPSGVSSKKHLASSQASQVDFMARLAATRAVRGANQNQLSQQQQQASASNQKANFFIEDQNNVGGTLMCGKLDGGSKVGKNDKNQTIIEQIDQQFPASQNQADVKDYQPNVAALQAIHQHRLLVPSMTKNTFQTNPHSGFASTSNATTNQRLSAPSSKHTKSDIIQLSQKMTKKSSHNINSQSVSNGLAQPNQLKINTPKNGTTLQSGVTQYTLAKTPLKHPTSLFNKNSTEVSIPTNYYATSSSNPSSKKNLPKTGRSSYQTATSKTINTVLDQQISPAAATGGASPSSHHKPTNKLMASGSSKNSGDATSKSGFAAKMGIVTSFNNNINMNGLKMLSQSQTKSASGKNKPKILPTMPVSFCSENILQHNEYINTAKQLPLEPIRMSYQSDPRSEASTVKNPLPSQRPLPLEQDTESPPFTQAIQSIGDEVAHPISTIGEIDVEEVRTEEDKALMMYIQGSKSSILQPPDFSFKSTVIVNDVTNPDDFINKPNQQSLSKVTLKTQIVYPRELLLQKVDSDQNYGLKADVPQNCGSYQNPTVTESDCDQKSDEGNKTQSLFQRLVDEDQSVQEEDVELDDGEQKYETEGELDSQQTTLNDRIMALPAGTRTPYSFQENTLLFPQSPLVHLDSSEQYELANDQETLAEASVFQDNKLNYRTLNNRSLISKDVPSQSKQITTTQQMQTMLARSQINLPVREANDLIYKQARSYRPPIRPYNNNNDDSDDFMLSGDNRLTPEVNVPLLLKDKDVATCKHHTTSLECEDRSQSSASDVGSESQRLTLRQVLKLESSQRHSLHFEREKLTNLETIRQRMSAKTRRESSEVVENKMDQEKLSATNLYQMNLPTESADISTSFASFLKTKAKKAYQFGEGLVKQIASTTAAQLNKSEKMNESQNFSLPDGANLHTSSEKISPILVKKPRQPAISMQFRDKFSLKDFYEHGTIMPKQDGDEEKKSMGQIEIVDAKMMSAEADFVEHCEDKKDGQRDFQSNCNIQKMECDFTMQKEVSHRDSISDDGPLSRFSNTVDLTSPTQPPFSHFSNLNNERLTFGMKHAESSVDNLKTPKQYSTIKEAGNSRIFSERGQFTYSEHISDHNQKVSAQNKTTIEADVKTFDPGHSDSLLINIPDQADATLSNSESSIPTRKSRPRNSKSGHSREETRRKSIHSAFAKKPSIFDSAIESLFGKNSIFSALDEPNQEHIVSNNDPDANQLSKLHAQSNQRISRSQDRRKSCESLSRETSSYRLFMNRKDLLGPILSEDDPKYRSYTLVLDLDETLVHFEHRRMVYKVRPMCMRFLADMAKLYEIVIFTAAHQTYANFILDKLDPDGTLIQHRLYRQHTTQAKGAFIKDLTRLGRPLERILIIDNLKENFQRQRENGIECGTWKGSVHDRQLNTFSIFLTKLAKDAPSDIRPHIAEFKKKFNPNSLQ